MSSSVFCPLESRAALEQAAGAMVKQLGMSREEAFSRLLRSFGVLCEHVPVEAANALAESLRQHGLSPVVKDDSAVLRPPRAQSCLGFQVRANVLRVFYRDEFEDVMRRSLLLISYGQVVVRRAATAPRKQADRLRTLFHAGAGARGASPEAHPQGAAAEQSVHYYLDLYAATANELRHLRADRQEINFKACLARSSDSTTKNFERFLELLKRYFPRSLRTADHTFHSVADFDRHNRFLLNYPW